MNHVCHYTNLPFLERSPIATSDKLSQLFPTCTSRRCIRLWHTPNLRMFVWGLEHHVSSLRWWLYAQVLILLNILYTLHCIMCLTSSLVFLFLHISKIQNVSIFDHMNFVFQKHVELEVSVFQILLCFDFAGRVWIKILARKLILRRPYQDSPIGRVRFLSAHFLLKTFHLRSSLGFKSVSGLPYHSDLCCPGACVSWGPVPYVAMRSPCRVVIG